MTQKAYPLHWPDGWPRVTSKRSSQFKTSLSGALKNVNDSLRKFSTDSEKKIENLVISSNISLAESKPADSGVALYFSWNGLSTCIAVDRYKTVEENLQAIHHCIEAERTKLRHGGINIVSASFRGYAALPPPSSSSKRRHWSAVIDINVGASLEDIEAKFKTLARKHHPDNGGSADKMAEINQAISDARKEKGRG